MLKAETYGLTTVQPVTLKSPEHNGDAFRVLSKVFSAKSVVKCGIRMLRVILESFWNRYTQHLQGSTFARRLDLWLQLWPTCFMYGQIGLAFNPIMDAGLHMAKSMIASGELRLY